MSEIEKIQRYIKTSKLDKDDRYDMSMIEGLELAKAAYEAKDLPLEIIVLAFNYGKAKGYRASKAKRRKAVT